MCEVPVVPRRSLGRRAVAVEGHVVFVGVVRDRRLRSALGLDDDDDDSPGGGSFDDGSFGGSEGAAPTPAGIDGAIAEEDEGEDASPAK